MLRHWSARGLGRRPVCFVSLIAVRGLSPVVLSLSLSLRSPSSPFSSSPATSLLLRRGRHFIFKKRPASVHFRPFSTQPRLLSLSLSVVFSPSSPFSLSRTFGRVAAYGGAMATTAILTAMRLERKRNWHTDGKSSKDVPHVFYLERVLGTGKRQR